MTSQPRPALSGIIGHNLPRWLVLTLVTLALLLLVAHPLGWILWNSFHDDSTKELTLGNYQRMFTRPSLWIPIVNSLLLAFSVALFSTLIGVPLAWLVARTDMPGRGFIRAMTMTAFVTPSFIGALGWILLAAPRAGWLNVGWRNLTGAEGQLLDIYTMTGTIFVCAIYTVPYTFALVASAFDEMAVELEDAATTLGAGKWRTMLSITVPLASPAFLVGFILSFIQGMTLFGVPAFLLTPSGTRVVTTQLAEFYQLFPPEIFLAAAYCMPLLIVTAGLFWIRRRILGRRQFTTIGGKTRRTRRIALGARARWLGFAFAMIVPVTAVILPFAALLLVSLSKAWGMGPVSGNFTLDWYRWALLENGETQRAIVNSLLYAGIAASVCMLLGVVVAYISERRLFSGAAILGALATTPIIIPGIVLSVGFFSAYTRPPFGFYGSAVLVIAAFVATFLPIAYSQGTTTIKGISPDLERAARSVGAGEIRTFLSITAPLMRTGLVSGWLLVFIPIMRELSVAIFLVSPKTNVMTTLIYNYKDGGNYEAVAATSVVLLAGTLVIVLLARLLVGQGSRRTRKTPTTDSAA
ncbi:ABC transporter permease [Pseudogemmobacter humi]|uniref:Molybdenum transport system permease protein ModB n=1 Tax=Pseudogemmobacter humi TaxID=2483812 RepID=A0A3P5X281_9RHOB|nr:iron ABC transporter permease [Pseudogemmobacter humi]VDC28026.1 Molybdenum transport system permease protein ModB [Pseudogemmobacter humi]